MRVLRVIYDLQTGGVQRMILRIAAPLRAHGIELEVCCLRAEGAMAPAFREAGIPVHKIRFPGRLSPSGLWKLRRLARRGGYDLVHSHMYASNVAAVAALLGSRIPVVNGYHSQTPFARPSQERMARLCATQTRGVVAVSSAVADAVAATGVHRDRIIVIPNGIQQAPELTALPPIGPGEPIRIAFIGRFVRQKRPFMALDIATLLREMAVPFQLTMVGDGPQAPAVRERVQELGLQEHVLFTGWASDVRPMLQTAHLYLSTSDREGLPNTLLEALSEGRGAVVADIGPNREVLADSGGGVLAGTEPADWAAAIAELAARPDRLHEMSRAAWRRAADFSIERTALRTAELYRSILGQ